MNSQLFQSSPLIINTLYYYDWIKIRMFTCAKSEIDKLFINCDAPSMRFSTDFLIDNVEVEVAVFGLILIIFIFDNSELSCVFSIVSNPISSSAFTFF